MRELFGVAWCDTDCVISVCAVQLGGQLGRQELAPNPVPGLVICTDQRVDSVPEVGPVAVGSAFSVLADDDFGHGCGRRFGKNAVAALVFLRLIGAYDFPHPLEELVGKSLKVLCVFFERSGLVAGSPAHPFNNLHDQP